MLFHVIFTCVPGYFICMYVCTSYEFNAHGGQKSELGILELELQRALSHHAGTGNQTHAFWKSNWYPQPLNHLCSLHTMIIRLMYAACMSRLTWEHFLIKKFHMFNISIKNDFVYVAFSSVVEQNLNI